MRAAPAVSCAIGTNRRTHTSIQVQRRTSDIPCAMARRLITRSPRRIHGFCLRRLTETGTFGPVGPSALPQDLTPTSFRHRVHTLLPYASAPLVHTFQNRSRSLPALPSHSAHDAAASTATPAPTFGNDGQRPFLRNRMAGFLMVIWVSGKAKFYPTG